MKRLIIGVTIFLTLVDLFAAQAILPSLGDSHGDWRIAGGSARFECPFCAEAYDGRHTKRSDFIALTRRGSAISEFYAACASVKIKVGGYNLYSPHALTGEIKCKAG